ncbi:MAG TPA: hypothetical protein VE078_17065 [Thermoanaerobaculia bacterium]|nr:hypothetical protein [Thermoanaerobaculia bacterium]
MRDLLDELDGIDDPDFEPRRVPRSEAEESEIDRQEYCSVRKLRTCDVKRVEVLEAYRKQFLDSVP